MNVINNLTAAVLSVSIGSALDDEKEEVSAAVQ